MKNKSKILTLFAVIIFFISGCASLTGNSLVRSATEKFNTYGVTYEGAEELVEGLGYVPDSVEGIALFNKEYPIVESQAKNILLKNGSINSTEMDILSAYVVMGGEGQVLKTKIPTLVYDGSTYLNSKSKMTKLIENYIVKEDLSNVPRHNKVLRLNQYITLGKYIPSTIIRDKAIKLEKEVRVVIDVVSDYFSFDPIDRMLENQLDYYGMFNRNEEVGSYVYIGDYYRGRSSPNSNYTIEVDFTNVRVFPTISRTEQRDGKVYLYIGYDVNIRGRLELRGKDNIGLIDVENFYVNDYVDYPTPILQNGGRPPHLPNYIENKLGHEIQYELDRSIKNLINKNFY